MNKKNICTFSFLQTLKKYNNLNIYSHNEQMNKRMNEWTSVKGELICLTFGQFFKCN